METRDTRFAKELFIGVMLGAVGSVARYGMLRFFGVHDVSIGAGDALMIVAAFFFGVVPGLWAGVLCSLASAYFGYVYCNVGYSGAIQGGASSLLATLAAIAIRRFTFFNSRPSLEPAMFFAALVALVHVTATFLLGLGSLSETMVIINNTCLPFVLACMIICGAASLVLRVPHDAAAARRICLAFVIFVSLVSIVWIADGKACLSAHNNSADVLTDTLITEIDYLPEAGAYQRAQLFADEIGSVEAAKKVDLVDAARRYEADRLAVVDKNGKIIASTDPREIGFDIAGAKDKDIVEFAALNDGERYMSIKFRPAFIPEKEDVRYKFVGFAFPDGGFVILGDSLRDYAEHLYYLFEQVMVNWPAGDRGSYILINPKTGNVLSALSEDWIGRSITETGLDVLKFPEADGSGEVRDVRGVVLGVDSLVRKVDFDFVDVDAYMAIPYDEIMYNRDLSTLVFLLVLTAIFIFGSMLLAKINRQQQSLMEFYAKDEERRHRDLELAKSIQHSALPSVFVPFPGSHTIDLYALMRTAKEVGGDFFDFYPLSKRKLFMVVADVSDKGVPAALFMMKAKAAIHAAAIKEIPLPEVMSEANDALCENNVSNMFVTCWIGLFDQDTGELEYVSAGHNPPYIRRANGKVEMLSAPRALVLACMAGVKYRLCTGNLNPGDRLFLYTDGVTEATAVDGSLFGERRLEDVLAKCQDTAVATCDSVVVAVDKFAVGAPQADDITALAMVYKGG